MNQKRCKRSKPSFFTTLCTSLMAVLLLNTGVQERAYSEQGVYPIKLPERLILPPASDPRVRQVDRYGDDPSIKIESQVEYRNGVDEEIKYWSNGNARESIKLYPLEPGQIERHVKRKAQYAPDGKTFVSHDVFRPDGTLSRQGRLQNNGDYEARFFFQDGKSVERVRIFNKNRRFVSEKIFRADGVPAAEIAQAGAEIHIVLYDAIGHRRASYYSSVSGGEHGEVYGVDGNTIHVIFNKERSLLQADYYDDRGVLVQRSSKSFGVLTVSAIDGNGVFRQTWRDRRGRDGTIKQTLSTVEELDTRRKLVRTINLSQDGSRPLSVEYPGKDGRTVKYLADDGVSVATVQVLDLHGDVRATHHPRKERIQIDSVRLLLPVRDELPSFNDFGPRHVYDHEDIETILRAGGS